jgi:F-type H+-transporting ATPase subunit gamma
MAHSLRDLRQKIKGVKSTRQVTKAMELVSASKMRKAIHNTTVLRRYSISAWEILQRVAAQSEQVHPALVERPVRNVLVLLFTSDRGLAGSLNAQVTRMVAQYLREAEKLPGYQSAEFVAVGKKGQQFLARTQQKVVAAFPSFSTHPTFRDILPVARLALDGFNDGKYDHVVLMYTDFISALVQQPAAKVLLPLSRSDLRDMIDGLLPKHEQAAAKQQTAPSQAKAQYQFEPSAEAVLGTILPQITELQVYQALLEAAASEHSARMVAMRNATDNANDLIGDLTLTYNQTRQANITGELAELSASKAALES